MPGLLHICGIVVIWGVLKCHKLPRYGSTSFLYGVSTDSRDITPDLLNSIDEHAIVLQNNLH